MQDITLPAARTERDQLASRVDVLDKVGVLRTLPDDMNVTTEMVAEFYEVPKETIFTLVRNNRDEIEDDGYRVVTRAAFEGTFETKVPSSASRIALFPRRAVLRVGMLLRDSDVARQTRDYLLDVETATVRPISPDMLPDRRELALWVIEAEDRATKEKAGRIAAEAESKMLTSRIEKDAPLVAKAEAHSASDNAAIHRQAFAREVQAWGLKQGVTIMHEHVYELLRRRGMLVSGNRSDRNHATSQAVKAGWSWTRKDTTPTGHATAVTIIRAAGQDIAWKWITAHVNEFGDLRPQAGAA